MNRFDRITSLLLLLQTRTVITAQSLATHFGVTERTIYRDIRTLENAGVPIGAEAGVGYFLEKGYHLPPVSFTRDEAASLLLGEKLLLASLDAASHADYRLALNKVRAVLDRADKDYLASLESDIDVSADGSAFPALASGGDSSVAGEGGSRDRWLRECRSVLVRRQVVAIDYRAGGIASTESRREIEPIGLYFYRSHWHLIAWCRLRSDYRDFRLDRIETFDPLPEQVPRHSRESLQQYLARQQAELTIHPVEVVFDESVVRFVSESRYEHGFIDEDPVDGGVRMQFLCAHPEFMARWLLQYTSAVRHIDGEAVSSAMRRLCNELSNHWR